MSYTKILETVKQTLIDINDQVDQNELSDSIGFSIPQDIYPEGVGGELYQYTLYLTVAGTGTLQSLEGKIIVLDADPAAAAGDADLTAAEWGTVIGIIDIETIDWVVESNAAVACIKNQPLAFHPLTDLYFVWLHTDATSLNDVAGDDYKLEMNAWMRLGG